MSLSLLPRLANLLNFPSPNTDDPHLKVVLGLFPGLHVRDAVALLSWSTLITLQAGDTVYRDGERQEYLYCVLDGMLIEHLREGDIRKLECPSLVGEAGWLIKDPLQTSVPKLIANTATKLLRWDYLALDHWVKKRPDLRLSLLDGMAGSLAKPGQLLDPNSNRFRVATPALMRLKNIAFPSLSSEQFELLIGIAEENNTASGKILDTRLHISLITAGNVRISRADGHYLDLGEGSFLGEIGWAAPERPGKEYVVIKAISSLSELRWSYCALEALHHSSPRLYAGIVHGLARDLAVKLSLPMQKVRVMEEAKAMSN